MYKAKLLKTTIIVFLSAVCSLQTAFTQFSQERLSEKNEMLIQTPFYSVVYSCQLKFPKFVEYKVRKQKLTNFNISKVEVINNCIGKSSSVNYDYQNTGFQKGHLIPKKYLKKTEIDNFVNNFILAPQLTNFNQKIWNRIDNRIDRYSKVKKVKKIHITCGGLSIKDSKMIKEKYTIPESFYKVVLVEYNENVTPRFESIGYLVPNINGLSCMCKYVKSIDEIEEFTGFVFFQDIRNSEIEESKKLKSKKMFTKCKDKNCILAKK